jgi:hypothetical protein
VVYVEQALTAVKQLLFKRLNSSAQHTKYALQQACSLVNDKHLAARKTATATLQRQVMRHTLQ